MCWVVCGGFLSVFVFYTSLVESPTNFKQRYANYVHYTVQPQSYTTHSGEGGGAAAHEETVTPFGDKQCHCV